MRNRGYTVENANPVYFQPNLAYFFVLFFSLINYFASTAVLNKDVQSYVDGVGNNPKVIDIHEVNSENTT